MSVSRRALWQTQLRSWPDSVMLTPQDILHWADAPPNPLDRYTRYHQISMALQYPQHIWYCTKKVGSGAGHIGCRYGIKGHQYLSGFGML